MLSLLFSQALVCCGNGENEDKGKNGIGFPPYITEDYKYTKNPVSAVRLLTYNAFYCKSNTSVQAFTEDNTKNFADVIRVLDADIVAIQELDSGVVSRGKRFLLKDIQQATGKNYTIIFAHAAKYDGGDIGCGLLISDKYKIEKVERIVLPGNEKRMLLIAHLKDFIVMSTHLDLDDNARKVSAGIIVDAAKAHNKPVWLAGDLNDSPAWEVAISAFAILNQSFNIISAIDGELKNNIDFVLLHKENAALITKMGSSYVKRLFIDGQVKELTAVSDHYPVFVDFRIK